MAKPEWGAKRTCNTCGARFYDLHREPIVCPVCGAVHDPDRQPKPRRPGPAVKEEPVLASPSVSTEPGAESLEDDLGEADAGEVELEDVEEPEANEAGEEELTKEDNELIEDTSELGEDDDDIGEVMEHVDDELDDKA